MTFMRRAVLAFVALSLAACYPVSSKYPLGGATSDTRLVGTWHTDDEDMTMVFKRQGRKKLSLEIYSDDTDDAHLYYEVRPSKIEGNTYMSVTQVFPSQFYKQIAAASDISTSEARSQWRRRDKEMNGYYFGHYTIETGEDGDMLNIAMMDDDSELVAAALEDGTLKGGPLNVTNEEGEQDDILYLTSSTRALTDFVAAHAGDPELLFDLQVADELIRK